MRTDSGSTVSGVLPSRGHTIGKTSREPQCTHTQICDSFPSRKTDGSKHTGAQTPTTKTLKKQNKTKQTKKTQPIPMKNNTTLSCGTIIDLQKLAKNSIFYPVSPRNIFQLNFLIYNISWNLALIAVYMNHQRNSCNFYCISTI